MTETNDGPVLPGELPAEEPAPAEEPVLAGRDPAPAEQPVPIQGLELAGAPPLRALLEAVLMVTENPVPLADLASGLGAPVDDVAATLVELAAEYERDERGFSLRDVGGGWRFYTADGMAPWVERFVLAGQTARLSQAALETLAVVAYQQPVSRGRISAVRGVSADGVIRTLTTRGLVEEAGADGETGATLYRTTPYFLERLGLRDLSELPPLAPLLPGIDEVDEVAVS